MEEAAVSLASKVIKSATSRLLTRISAMKELKEDISDIKDELPIMLSFLRIAERLKEKDESTKTIIKQTRYLAFDMKDIIDEFTCKLGEEQGGVLPKIVKRCRNITTWRRLSKRLNKIKIKLQNNKKERSGRYDTSGMEKEERSRIAACGSKSHAELAYFVEEDNIVGIDKYRDLLLRWLKGEDEQQRQPMIISVLGMGGLGKTTLVTHVYNIIKATFDACAWVVVSQSYKTHDLLRQILKEFSREDRENREAPNNIDTMDCRSLVETICTYLQDKKYILILDDVWSTDVMDEVIDKVKVALLNSNSKGRIVLTTRIRDVALLANENRMLALKPLEPDHSWDLFCKYAFSKSANKICPPPCAKKIVEKCGGMPLAIISIARLVSRKAQNDSEREKVCKDLERKLINNESNGIYEKVYDILKLSLDDLPNDLLNCFLYCSSFPEDHRFQCGRLKRLWEVEGFIEEKKRKEGVAEDYLNELFHRCLLQVVCRDNFGNVLECQMHDVIRALALSESKELSFCMVYEHSRETLQISKAHRLSILSNVTDYRTEGKSHLRSVLAFNNSMSYDLLKSVLRSSKFLRVLELEGALIEKLPSEICNLFNLHYLGLGATKIKELPRSIGKLQNLQQLTTGGSEIEKLPKEITKLQKLEHLSLSRDAYQGIEAPVGIWRLKGLQVLASIGATTMFVRKVEALTKLQIFWITGVRTDHCANLWNSITKMNHLWNLFIASEDGQELQQLGTLRLPLPIQELHLKGKLDKTSVPEFATPFRSLTKLTKLTFSFGNLDEDTFPCLQALPALTCLRLGKAYDGMKLHFQATSFPKLIELYILEAPKLSQMKIERGAMASLEKLDLYRCPELKELPHGFEYLTLQDLHIIYPAVELVELLLGGGEGDHIKDCHTTVRRIPSFTFWFELYGENVKKRFKFGRLLQSYRA